MSCWMAAPYLACVVRGTACWTDGSRAPRLFRIVGIFVAVALQVLRSGRVLMALALVAFLPLAAAYGTKTMVLHCVLHAPRACQHGSRDGVARTVAHCRVAPRNDTTPAFVCPLVCCAVVENHIALGAPGVTSPTCPTLVVQLKAAQDALPDATRA